MKARKPAEIPNDKPMKRAAARTTTTTTTAIPEGLVGVLADQDEGVAYPLTILLVGVAACVAIVIYFRTCYKKTGCAVRIH